MGEPDKVPGVPRLRSGSVATLLKKAGVAGSQASNSSIPAGSRVMVQDFSWGPRELNVLVVVADVGDLFGVCAVVPAGYVKLEVQDDG